MSPLLETDEGRTADWVIVKRVYSRFDKRREWSDQGLEATGAATGQRSEEPTPARMDVTRRWFEDHEVPMDVVKGPSGGVALEKLMKMVRDLQITQARRDSGGQARDRKPLTDQRCMWCDAIGHTRRDCVDFTEALRSNVVYLRNGQVHESETQEALRWNTGWGGMKRLMEEATTGHAEAIHYSASAGIRVGTDGGPRPKDSRF